MKRIPCITAYFGNGISAEVETSVYPDNAPIIRAVGTHEIPRALLVRPLTLTDFMAALFWADAICERSSAPISLVLPAIPGARQDRINPQGDCLFTAKSIAKEINARGFDRVVALDPHSDVAPALIDRCMVVHSHEVAEIVSTLRNGGYGAIISPDGGAEKRAGGMARRLGLPMFRGWKVRNVSDGSLDGFGCESIPESIKGKLLIVDDICDGGGTFLGLRTEIARRSGLQCDLFVSHGLFSRGTRALCQSFGEIICTDSMVQSTQAGVKIIDVCDSIAKGATR